jgi:UDP-glucose 4-epimerase
MSQDPLGFPVLVTGGAGYVGSVIVECLLSAGSRVIVVDNFVQGHRDAVLPDATLVEADIGNQAQMERVLRENHVGAVIHMAAETVIARSMVDPGIFFRQNVAKGIALLDAMTAVGVKRLVFSSTAAVYGHPQQVPITEDHPKHPISPYGVSKWMFENILPWYRLAHGLSYVCLRYFNASGATERLGEGHEPESHLIPLILQVALGQRPEVAVFGGDYDTPDGSCVRDYVHVIDMAQAHIQALRRVEELGATAFNIGSGRGYSVREVVDAARVVTGHPIPAVIKPRRPGDPAVLQADHTRALAELDWHPQRQDISLILASAWAWHRAHPNGYAR